MYQESEEPIKGRSNCRRRVERISLFGQELEEDNCHSVAELRYGRWQMLHTCHPEWPALLMEKTDVQTRSNTPTRQLVSVIILVGLRVDQWITPALRFGEFLSDKSSL